MIRNRALLFSIRTLVGRLAPVLLILVSSAEADARLERRLGGKAYYDTKQDLLWLTDASLNNSRTSYGNAVNAIEELNEANHLGFNDWRLPIVTDTGSLGCTFSTTGGTDCGQNVDPGSSEIAHLFFKTLKNVSSLDKTGRSQTEHPRWRNPDMGPFKNANLQYGHYWLSPIRRVTVFDYRAWIFNLRLGDQDESDVRLSWAFIWPVRTGDVNVRAPYDSDRDHVTDPKDAFPRDGAASVDTDGDGRPDDWNADSSSNLRAASRLRVDVDDDNDLVLDDDDNCRIVENADQADLDADDVGDVCDQDIDGDGMTNVYEAAHALNPLDAADAHLDFDSDGLSNIDEFLHGTGVSVPDSDGDEITDGVEVMSGRSPTVNEGAMLMGILNLILE